eukprot:CAMPEP_0195521550 /NCGR_PEP_ID=MMETSP0794_2-20130614/18932_1 /TAXON_ID=515487 /ORGANISM="Stephanopyxis turris, Strain CCMP 815" /LENGTH=148 /DNA_ID=CAMNT_0040651127 /DNA_START=1 /DNA_END=447 /DNA_ORIENTATION=-
MEEAEALCTRLTIMVSGRMRCLGSVQHLKATYLDGYTVDLQLRSHASSHIIERIKSYVLETAFPFSSLSEQHNRFLKFAIPNKSNEGISVGLGGLFRVFEEMKSDPSLMVETYSLSQSTLEQVFIQFAKKGDGAICGNENAMVQPNTC